MDEKTEIAMINIKRIYAIPEEKDGYRILIDRLWPRGIKKDKARIDRWFKEAAPSSELRKWFHEKPIERWPAFKKNYKAELKKNKDLEEFEKLIEEHPVITLIFGAKDEQHNHALVLQHFLNEKYRKTTAEKV